MSKNAFSKDQQSPEKEFYVKKKQQLDTRGPKTAKAKPIETLF